jgi:hypothetical protein
MAAVIESVADFRGTGKQEDDVTLVVAKMKRSGEAAVNRNIS